MNKLVNWIIDKGMFEDYEDRLVDAINKLCVDDYNDVYI